MEYIPRLIEPRISDYLNAFGAVVITGPKWCGKTSTAEKFAKSSVYMQDNLKGMSYREIASLRPLTLLEGDKPRLIDEWQEAPALWDSVRRYVDRAGDPGQFILTGSVIADRSEIRHAGTGRFGEIRMRTMSLFEYGESTGEVRLSDLFEGKTIAEGMSKHELPDICRLIIRGGWPSTMGESDEISQDIVKSYCESAIRYGISEIDGRRRDGKKARAVLRSLSANTATSASVRAIRDDILDRCGETVHENTVSDYMGALDSLFITDNVSAWCPKLRTKTAVRLSDARYLTDPSIAAYFLETDAEGLLMDPETLGLLFKNLVMRDLKVYAEPLRGNVCHYRDKNGLEADAIIRLRNGKWGAMEFKLNPKYADAGAATLLKLKGKVDDTYLDKLSFLAVVTSTGFAYTRPDGVHVIPIGCLRD